MEFKSLIEWGHVNTGTRVADSKGNHYLVEAQNAQGFLRLKNLSGGDHQAFEVMDFIDHNEFQLVFD